MAYTTNIVSIATLPDGRKNIGVQFTNGTITTPTEFIIPQDKNGLDYFISGRLSALNFVEPTIGDYVLPVPPTPTVLTQQEIDLQNFERWLNLTIAVNAAKQMGWVTGNEPMITDIKNKVLALAAINLPKLFT